MILITFTVCCAAVYYAQAHPTYYRPYYHERSSYITDDKGYGDVDGYRSYDDSGHKQRHHTHASHGASDYDSGEVHSLRDRIKKNKHNEGAKSSVHASGGKEDHVKKSHDKAFYEREKKYGYEKSYGYERETKHHDKGSTSHSSGSNYDHKESKENHKSGEQFLRDLAEHSNKFDKGSKSHGSKSDLFDTASHRNIGKDIESELSRGLKFFKRSGPISNFSPNYIPKEYMFGVGRALDKFKYMSGIHGLGGLRAYGLNYGYNPVRYKYAGNHFDSELMDLIPYGEMLFDLDHPGSRVLYDDPEIDL